MISRRILRLEGTQQQRPSVNTRSDQTSAPTMPTTHTPGQPRCAEHHTFRKEPREEERSGALQDVQGVQYGVV